MGEELHEARIADSWAPHQCPTREQMEAAVDHFLKGMGWQEHQAPLIAHNDEPHPHLHIILNRVHIESGLTLRLARRPAASRCRGFSWDASRSQ